MCANRPASVAVACAAWLACAPAMAAVPTTAAENARAGTTRWYAPHPSQDGIAGYAGSSSYLRGQTVRLFVDSRRPAVPLSRLPARVVPGRERPARGVRPRGCQPRAGVAEDPRRPIGRGEAARDRLARVALLSCRRELAERLLPRAPRPGRRRRHELRLVRRARQHSPAPSWWCSRRTRGRPTTRGAE